MSKLRKYRKSRAWKDLRYSYLRSKEYKCEGCGAEKDLSVAAITFDHFGHETFDDLRLLCVKCNAENELRLANDPNYCDVCEEEEFSHIVAKTDLQSGKINCFDFVNGLIARIGLGRKEFWKLYERHKIESERRVKASAPSPRRQS